MAKDLDNHFGVNGDIAQAYLEESVAALSPFIPADKLDNTKAWIGGVFEMGINLSRMFLKSKAIIRTPWVKASSSSPTTFNAERMEWAIVAQEWGSEMVTHCISPFVRKTGNADGQALDQSTILFKAAVMSEEYDWSKDE